MLCNNLADRFELRKALCMAVAIVNISSNARKEGNVAHLLMNFMTFSRYHMKQLTQHIKYLTNTPATPALA